MPRKSPKRCEDFVIAATHTVVRRTDCTRCTCQFPLSPSGVEFFKIPPDVLIPLTPGLPRSFPCFSNFPFISLFSLLVTLSYSRHSCFNSSNLPSLCSSLLLKVSFFQNVCILFPLVKLKGNELTKWKLSFCL